MGYPSIVGLTQLLCYIISYVYVIICTAKISWRFTSCNTTLLFFFSELLVDLEFSASCNFLVFWMQLHVAVTNSVHAQEEAVEMFQHDDYGSGRIHTGWPTWILLIIKQYSDHILGVRNLYISSWSQHWFIF